MKDLEERLSRLELRERMNTDHMVELKNYIKTLTAETKYLASLKDREKALEREQEARRNDRFIDIDNFKFLLCRGEGLELCNLQISDDDEDICISRLVSIHEIEVLGNFLLNTASELLKGQS